MNKLILFKGILEAIEFERKKRKQRAEQLNQTEEIEPKKEENKELLKENKFIKKTKEKSPETPKNESTKKSKYRNTEYVTNRLREIGEPIKLFDESDFNRIKRLKLAELNLHVLKQINKFKGKENIIKRN